MRRKKGIVRAVKRQSYEKRRPSRIGQATETGAGREEGNTAAVVAREEWPGKRTPTSHEIGTHAGKFGRGRTKNMGTGERNIGGIKLKV